MDRTTGRATATSIALHAIVLSGALLIRAHVPDGAGQSSVIEATLLFDAGGWPSSASAPGPTDDPVAPQSSPAEVADSTPAATERAADAPVAENPSPPAAAEASASEPDAAPAALASSVESAKPDGVEPSNEAPAAPSEGEREVAENATDESAAATATVADASATDSPAAEIATGPSPEAVATAAAVRGARHSEPMPARERAMLSQRFASWTGELAAGESAPRVAWRQKGQAYTAVFRQVPAGDATGIEHVVIDVSTEQGGKKMSTQLTMTRLAFSNFAQFVDHWNPEVQIHDDEIDGRFHSNTGINLLSTSGVSPVFHGKVTLAAHDINTDSSWTFNRRRVFPEGLETGVHRIVLPSRFLAFLNEAASGDANVQRFERDARITFYEDGSYGWSYVRDGGSEERRMLTSPAHYLLGLPGATLRIKGRVRGKVLVYAAERIVIDNDLRYAHARDAPDADDYLGIVAERAVEIAEPEVTGLGDLEIDASIYALREFAVRDFRSRPSGTLRIFGSLTAGSLTATEPRFATKIEFDPRLNNARPPSFPLTDRYELESWNGVWHVEDDAASGALVDDGANAGGGAERDEPAETARN